MTAEVSLKPAEHLVGEARTFCFLIENHEQMSSKQLMTDLDAQLRRLYRYGIQLPSSSYFRNIALSLIRESDDARWKRTGNEYEPPLAPLSSVNLAYMNWSSNRTLRKQTDAGVRISSPEIRERFSYLWSLFDRVHDFGELLPAEVELSPTPPSAWIQESTDQFGSLVGDIASIHGDIWSGSKILNTSDPLSFARVLFHWSFSFVSRFGWGHSLYLALRRIRTWRLMNDDA
jgi:hypothetical protein